MKCWIIMMFGIFVLATSIAMAQPVEKVLMIAREGNSGDLELMLIKEAGVMKDLLTRAGYEVVVASVSGQTIKAGTASLESNLKIRDVDLADYKGVILPCLAISADNMSSDVAALAKKAADRGMPVAAQTNSVRVLAEAGVLAGKKYAYARPDIAEEATYSGQGVVQDGKIITSGICPYMVERGEASQDGTSQLTKAFITVLKK